MRFLPVLLLAFIAGAVLMSLVFRFLQPAPRSPAPGSAGQGAPTGPAAEGPARTPEQMQAVFDERDRRIAQTQEEMERRELAQFNALASSYAAESKDAAWAGAKESRLLQASASERVAEFKAQPSALDVRCKQATCRIEADFANRTAADDWLSIVSMDMGGELPNVSFRFSPNPDGSVHVQAYAIGRK